MIEPLEARIAPATFLVNSLLDGAPAKDGKLTLREAILAATTNTAVGDAPAGDALADAITFAPTLAGGTVDLTLGELLIDRGGQLSITGPGANAESIAISGANTFRVLEVTNRVDAVLLSHLTIKNGNAGLGEGGGVLTAGSLFLDDVLVTQSKANFGGGIRSTTDAIKLSITHSRIVENSALAAGGISAGAGELIIHDTTIASNGATDGEGGGLWSGSTAKITASRIIGNQGAGGAFGAGIVNRPSGTMTIDETTISGNVGLGSTWSGGGISNEGTLTIRNSTLSGNTSQGNGGGIFNDGGTLTIINSTIAQNTALGSSGGGGIDSSGSLSVTNSTIVGNIDATSGGTGAGGIKVSGQVPIISNTIVAGNFAASGTSADVRGVFSAGCANNFIGVGANASILDGVNGNQVGTAGTPLSSKLGPLQDHGGRTFTMAPLVGSPVIDAGLNAAAVSPAGAALLTDQRGPGFARILDGTGAGGGTVDIGAVEFARKPNVTGVTAFTFNETSGEQVKVSLTGGGTFDLVLNTAGDEISQLVIHGATPASALAVKVLTPGGVVKIKAIQSDAALKSISLGKGAVFTGSIGIEGALGALALDTMQAGTFIRTGGTPQQTLKVTVNGDFQTALETTSAVGKLSLPKFTFQGDIRAAAIGDISALAFRGNTSDDAFDLGDNGRKDLSATSGPIGKLTAKGNALSESFGRYDIQAGPGATGSFGGIAATATNGFVGIREVSVTAARIGPISVSLAGAVLRGISDSSFIATNGGIASITVSLNFGTLTPDPSSSALNGATFIAAAGIGPITATATNAAPATKDASFGPILSSTSVAGTATLPTWASLSTASAQLTALKGSSLGAITASGVIDFSTFIAAGNIGAVTAPGGLTSSKILAGTSLGADRAFGGSAEDQDFYARPVTIGALTLKQPVGSVISAGIDPNDGVFGDGNDEAASSGRSTGGTSKIGPIKITASFSEVAANPGITHSLAIQAGAIAKLTINGRAIVPSAAGVALDTNSSTTDSASDILIRLV